MLFVVYHVFFQNHIMSSITSTSKGRSHSNSFLNGKPIWVDTMHHMFVSALFSLSFSPLSSLPCLLFEGLLDGAPHIDSADHNKQTDKPQVVEVLEDPASTGDHGRRFAIGTVESIRKTCFFWDRNLLMDPLQWRVQWPHRCSVVH